MGTEQDSHSRDAEKKETKNSSQQRDPTEKQHSFILSQCLKPCACTQGEHQCPLLVSRGQSTLVEGLLYMAPGVHILPHLLHIMRHWSDNTALLKQTVNHFSSSQRLVHLTLP